MAHGEGARGIVAWCRGTPPAALSKDAYVSGSLSRWDRGRVAIWSSLQNLRRSFRVQRTDTVAVLSGLVKWFAVALVASSAIITETAKTAFSQGWDKVDWLVAVKSAAITQLVPTIIIVVAQVYIHVHNGRLARRLIRHQKKTYSADIKTGTATSLLRFGQMAQLEPNRVTAEFESLVSDALQLIKREVRLYFKDFTDGQLEVTLLGFERRSWKLEAVTLVRADPIRPVGTRKRAEDTIAYHVARLGRAFTEPDLVNGQHPFMREGFSDQDPSYRSILLIPLVDRAGPEDPEATLGVVTVDSPDPYYFPATKAGLSDIVTRLQPHCAVIRLLLRSTSYFRVPVDRLGG
jgi:hypothetical protein